MADKKKIRYSAAWEEARGLIWAHRYRLAIGFTLMLISRVAGLVLPATSKYLIDEVIGRRNVDLLPTLAFAAGAATVVQAATTFALSQVLGVAAQRAITDMRRVVQEQVTRLPVRYFDSTQSGILISRIMTDAEGIRNLVGTGIVQLVGSLVTAALALAVLFYLNWRLTSVTIVVLLAFGGMMAIAFRRLRPLFRERGQINAEMTGRLAQSLGGIHIVKAYTAEKREADRLRARRAPPVPQHCEVDDRRVGRDGLLDARGRRHRRDLMMSIGGRADSRRPDDARRLRACISCFTGLVAAPVVQIASIGTQLTEAFAGLDRIREIRAMATEDRRATKAARRSPRWTATSIRGRHASSTCRVCRCSSTFPSARRPASTTALVGSSGSGKSTLISLVMAFNRPMSGTRHGRRPRSRRRPTARLPPASRAS